MASPAPACAVHDRPAVEEDVIDDPGAQHDDSAPDIRKDLHVKRLQSVLAMLADSRRRHEEATWALQDAVTTLMNNGTRDARHSGEVSSLVPSRVHSAHSDAYERDTKLMTRHLRSELVKVRSTCLAVMPSQTSLDAQRKLIQRLLRVSQKAARLPTALESVFHGTRISRAATCVLAKGRLETFLGIIIFLNSICIGIETQQQVYGEVSPVILILEHIFLSVYIFELSVLLISNGPACFFDVWFLFNFVLVLVGAVATWILQPLQAPTDSVSESGKGGMSQLVILRLCKLLRMVRVLRMKKQFRCIWKLIYGLLASVNTMISTLSLLAMVLYVFACLGVEMITKDSVLNDPQYPILNSIVDTNFKDLYVTFMFLFQFVTQDSVAAVYMPLIKAKPILAVYFLLLLLVVSISLMNLFTATIVEGALEIAHKDDELKRAQKKEEIRSMMPKLVRLFQQLDKTGSGNVGLEDIENMDQSMMPEGLSRLVRMETLLELFDILDVDVRGVVSKDEFIEGFLLMCFSDVPSHMMQVIAMLRTVRDKVNAIERNVLYTL